MRIATNGILVNEHGQVLLIQRNDTRTFALPGGGVELGELPSENAAREAREETGIIALPVRLVSLTYWPMKPDGMLTFTFRCLKRGGEMQTSAESPRVGFFAINKLPSPMLALSRKRIEQGVRHAGGPVAWWLIEDTAVIRLGRFVLFQVIHRWLGLRRKWRKEPPFAPPPNWSVSVQTVVQQKNGDVLVLPTENGWQLPGGLVTGLTPPWQTAVTTTKAQTGLDITLTNIRAVFVNAGSSDMTLVFTAVPASNQPQNGQWLAHPPLQNEQPHPILKAAFTPHTEPIFEIINNEVE